MNEAQPSAADAIAAKPARRYRAYLFQGYLLAAVVIFVVLAVLAKTVAYFTFDVTITRAIQNLNPWGFGALMYVLSWIGFPPQTYLITTLLVVGLFASGLKWESVVSGVSVAGSTLLGLGIKLIIKRPRPSADLANVVQQLTDYSFPSGHVLYFTVFFGFLLFLAYTVLKRAWWRSLLIVVLAGLVALIGVSRIFEGQHWASDVTGAYLLGSIWLSLTILVYRWGKPRYFTNQPAAKETPAG